MRYTTAFAVVASTLTRLALASSASETSEVINPTWLNKHAVVFTDMKLDDSVMIQMLSRPRKYERLHIVTTAVQSHEAAHGHLKDFIEKQRLDTDYAGFEATPYTVYDGGQDILEQSPARTHEQFFLGAPKTTPLTAEHDLNHRLPIGSIVDIFHVAPVEADAIHRIGKNVRIRIRLYYHLAGYNSYQDVPSHRTGKATRKTMDFLQGIDFLLRRLHPAVITVFTASPFSFAGSTGSTQPLEAFKGRINERHLQFALKDPFFVNKLTEAEELIAPLRHDEQYNLPPLMPPDADFRDKDLQSLIMMARFMQPEEDGLRLRRHFLTYLAKAIPPIVQMQSSPKLVYRLKTGVIKAFQEPPTIELADAVQAVCVLDAMELDEHGHWPVRNDLIPTVFPDLVRISWDVADNSIDHGATNGMAIMRRYTGAERHDGTDPHSEGAHGFSIVGATAERARALLFKSMPILPEYRQV